MADDITTIAREVLAIDDAYNSPRGCTDEQIFRRTRLAPALARWVLAQHEARKPREAPAPSERSAAAVAYPADEESEL